MEIEERRDGSIVLSGELARRFKIVGAKKMCTLLEQEYQGAIRPRVEDHTSPISSRELTGVMALWIKACGISRIVSAINASLLDTGPEAVFHGLRDDVARIEQAAHDQGWSWIRGRLTSDQVRSEQARAASQLLPAMSSKPVWGLQRATARDRALFIAKEFAAYVDRSPFTTDEIDAAVALFSTLRCLSGAPV